MPPAARVTDMHVCPMVTGIVPHVGGPILPPCSPNVLIGFLPAARVTDQAVCVGPPDIIVKGSPTVMINNLLAARVTDTTAHGGMIILGCFTAIIGEVGMGVPLEKLIAIQSLINDAAALTAAGDLDAAAEKKQQAINLAIDYFKIDTSKTKSITYDPDLRGEAITAPDTSVKIGDEAFRNAAWLGSSIGHEVEVHVNEQAAKGKWYTGTQGTAMQEVQAYDYELANQDRYGTNSKDVRDLQSRRDSQHADLNPDYQKQVDGSPPSYDLPAGHESD